MHITPVPTAPVAIVRRHAGFTLVELLVVIGIIAVLISILLPALSSARKQADTIKCAAAMREIGTGFVMYAGEFKGAIAPTRVISAYTLGETTYGAASSSTVGGKVVATTITAYWQDFLGTILARNKKLGVTAVTAEQAGDAQSGSVLWGCPAFGKYNSTAIGGFNRSQTGFGMNYLPTYSPSNPPIGQAYPVGSQDSLPYPGVPNKAGLQAIVGSAPSTAIWPKSTPTHGTWFKLSQYTQPSQRALVADCQFWLLEALAAPVGAPIPGQKFNTNVATYSANVSGQTLYDFYRHGKFPPIKVGGNDGYYDITGGKVSFNVLYADGHVATLNSREEGYKAVRQRFPG